MKIIARNLQNSAANVKAAAGRQLERLVRPNSTVSPPPSDERPPPTEFRKTVAAVWCNHLLAAQFIDSVLQ